jgi:hypothetical protein
MKGAANGEVRSSLLLLDAKCLVISDQSERVLGMLLSFLCCLLLLSRSRSGLTLWMTPRHNMGVGTLKHNLTRQHDSDLLQLFSMQTGSVL